MKKTFNYLFIILAGIITVSCNDMSNEQAATPQTEKVISLPSGDVLFNGSEFVFENDIVFREYTNRVSSDVKLKSEIELKYSHILLSGQTKNADFEKSYLFSTLTMPDYMAINKKGRVIIGDYAMRFDKIYQYSVELKNSSLLDSENLINSDSRVIKNKYGREPIGKSNLRTETQVNGNGGINNHQYNFTYSAPDPYAGQKTKYVNEFQGHVVVINPGSGIFRRSLLLVHKLEYISGSGNVYVAHQPRDITTNLNISGFLYWNNTSAPYNFTKSVYVTFNGVTEEVGGVIQEFYTGGGGGNGFWDFTANGSINSRVISPNGYNYTWNESGTLW